MWFNVFISPSSSSCSNNTGEGGALKHTLGNPTNRKDFNLNLCRIQKYVTH